jgi:hypothetical protein
MLRNTAHFAASAIDAALTRGMVEAEQTSC